MPRDRFDHLFIEPADFDAAIAFYRDALGWNVIAGWGNDREPRGAILDGGAVRVVLAEPHPATDHSKSHGINEPLRTLGAARHPSEREQFALGTAHRAHAPTLHLAVDDLDLRYRQIAARAEVVVPPETTHWGTRWFVLRDPDGNLIAYETPIEPLETRSSQP